MCLARVYLKEDDRDEIILENVASVEIRENSLLITTILRETKIMEARIKSIDFANGNVVLEKS
jgi:predicted RNA-binding protein